MRIVHLCNYIQPKLGYQEFYLAREHARAGHEVTVVASDRYFPFPDYDRTVRRVLGSRFVGAGVQRCDGFDIHRLPTSVEVGTKAWLRGLGQALKTLRPDILICHGMSDFNALRAASMKKRLNYRLVYDDHSIDNARKTGLTGWLFYRLFPFGKVLRHGDRLVGIADQSVQYIRDLYRFPSEAVEKIPLGADCQRFCYSPQARRDFRLSHGIQEEELVVGYTGKLTEAKGPHEILQAVGIAASEVDRPMTALLVGDIAEDYRNTFHDARRRLGGRGKVITLPAMDNQDLPAVYSGCDVCVWPRQASIAIIEAIATGRPVICPAFLTDCLSANNGIGLHGQGSTEIARAISTLARNPELRHEMGQRGRAMAERELSWSTIAERFIA